MKSGLAYQCHKEGIKKTKEKICSLEPKNTPSDQANLKNYLKSSLWCPGEDLNLHTLRYSLLKTARLPVPPPGLLLCIANRVTLKRFAYCDTRYTLPIIRIITN